MPHVNIKMYTGRTEEQKKALTDKIVKEIVNIVGVDEKYVSVAIQDVAEPQWQHDIYDGEIKAQQQYLFKKPGY